MGFGKVEVKVANKGGRIMGSRKVGVAMADRLYALTLGALSTMGAVA